MKIYNTLTRQIEEFKPLHDQQVGIYSCGPTVYDYAHIGNMRTYILSDLLVKTLKLIGYAVTHVMNITDIDDKMIDRAAREGITLSELAERYEDYFFADLAKLNIAMADVYPRATEHFPEMKELLNMLVKKGFAYEKDNEVYFDISAFKNYGRLSRLDQRELKIGARVAVQEYGKDDASDFVLWKVDEATKGHGHQPTKGGGRPGWHLECSAMSMKYLGQTFDFHVGGTDLIFPHHENEIAQSEAATGEPFVRYFIHGEMISVDGQKMSKSLGNIYPLSAIEERGIEPLAYRYLTLTAHYRSRLNFTWDSLAAAAKTLTAIRQLAYRPSQITADEKRRILEKGRELLEDDLNLPALLAILHEAGDYALWLAFEPVLSLGLTDTLSIPPAITALADQRLAAKRRQNWSAADALRRQIDEAGYLVEDLADGYRLIPKVNN